MKNKYFSNCNPVAIPKASKVICRNLLLLYSYSHINEKSESAIEKKPDINVEVSRVNLHLSKVKVTNYVIWFILLLPVIEMWV